MNNFFLYYQVFIWVSTLIDLLPNSFIENEITLNKRNQWNYFLNANRINTIIRNSNYNVDLIKNFGLRNFIAIRMKRVSLEYTQKKSSLENNNS